MLNSAQQRQFFDAGFVLVEDLIPVEVLAPLIAEFEDAIDATARIQHERGMLSELYVDEPFDHRLVLLCASSSDAAALWRLGQGKHHKTAGMFNVWTDASLVDVVEQFVGPEIFAHPQFNSRAKLPDQEETIVPWHQDGGLLAREAENTMMVNFWIPLVDAPMSSGALQVIPGSHRWGILPHVSMGFYSGVEKNHFPDHEVIDCPLPVGGALILQQQTMHRSVPNISDRVRWSLDLRYCATGAPTGRAQVPGFVVRSVADPAAVARNHCDWVKLFD